jgi:hypothetical protein
MMAILTRTEKSPLRLPRLKGLSVYDNGILMVVKGNHCGKYVRRIHHRYDEDNGTKHALILLAVVEKVDGAADTLTGEQIELGPDSLCIAVETSEDRKLNEKLMNSLRDNARKRR